MTDLSLTIAPKSDQLTADDLIAGPLTVKITGVSLCAEPDQPVAVNFEGDNGRPFKPCKSMRRVMVTVWGPDGTTYIGRRMTLFRDEEVIFGGAKVGGIRISHMSHITRDFTMALTVAKARRKPYVVHPLAEPVVTPPTERHQRKSVKGWLADFEVNLTNAKSLDEVNAILDSEDVHHMANFVQNGAKDRFEEAKRRALVRFMPTEPPPPGDDPWGLKAPAGELDDEIPF